MICSTSLNQLPRFGVNRVAIACGVFDGLHRGHQEIIKTLVRIAETTDSLPIVVTFNPHPGVVLNPDSAPKRLLSREHQLYLLKKLGVGATVVLGFTENLAALSPEEFLRQFILVDNLQVTTFCIGTGWRFGHKARGNVDLLTKLGRRYGFQVHRVEKVISDGEPISSTRVRTALSKGDLALVERLLGRYFSIMGTVGFGKGIATSDLSCPTANISSDHEVCPPYGVYASKVHLFQESGECFAKKGVLYIGESPTFIDTPPDKPFIEIHIFDFTEDIYGRTIEVEILKFLRGDVKFNSINKLRDQIIEDIKATKHLSKTAKPI